MEIRYPEVASQAARSAVILHRSLQLWRERGAVRFAKFVFQRVAFRSFERVLYEIDAVEAVVPESTPDRSVAIYDAASTIPERVLRFVEPGGRDYLEGVRRSDLLYVGEFEGNLVHFGYVMRQTRETAVLGEPAGTPLIGNCWTDPRARGRGIYPYALRAVVCFLRDRGMRRILIETDVSNTASRRGIEKAGFRLIRTYNAVIACNSVLIGRVEEGEQSRWKAWVIRRG
jgi:RimJ/RimL family protein N-acetyltransferase